MAKTFTTRIDLQTDAAQVVCDGPCKLKSIYVDTVLSAQACPILDGATTVFSLVASLAAGSLLKFDDMMFLSSLQVNSDDAATGVIVVTYEPVHGKVGSTDTI